MCSQPSLASKCFRFWTSRPIVDQDGFTLIEIMVGLFVGLVSLLFITQIFIASESQKRTTASVDDALVNGSLAMHTLESALKEAGSGIVTGDLLDCRLNLLNGVTIEHLAPVTINPPGSLVLHADDNSDTLLIVNGRGFGPPEGYRAEDFKELTDLAPQLFFKGSGRVEDSDRFVVVTTKRCNDSGLTLYVYPDDPAGVNPTMYYNLGVAPRFIAYAIRKGNLESCDLLDAGPNCAVESGWKIIASNIVWMKAEFGYDNDLDGKVDAYYQQLPSPTGVNPQCNLTQALTVRLVIASRGAQYEKEESTPYTSQVRLGGSEIKPEDVLKNTTAGNLDADDWKHYHYRFFQVIAPLRSLMSNGIQGC